MFLDHGLHSVDLNGDFPAKQWLSKMLRNCVWHPETIALFLRRQGNGGLPIQNLHGCLQDAIRGTPIGYQHELTEALILLVKGGADLYARDDFGLTVSEIVCSRKSIWYNGSWIDFRSSKRTVNHDLRLKEIWIEVLNVCGYDPEEVISASVGVEALSDCDTDSLLNLDEETSTGASDCSEGDNDSTTDREEEPDVSADDVSCL